MNTFYGFPFFLSNLLMKFASLFINQSTKMSKPKRIHKTYKKSVFSKMKVKPVNILLFMAIACFIFFLVFIY